MRLFGESGAALFVLMAVTVAHSVHVIEAMRAGLRQGMDRRAGGRHIPCRSTLWPVLLTSLTTAIGFLSLNFSGMPPFQRHGQHRGHGLALRLRLYSVTLLPAFLSLVPMRARARRAPGRVGPLRCLLGRFVVSHRTTAAARLLRRRLIARARRRASPGSSSRRTGWSFSTRATSSGAPPTSSARNSPVSRPTSTRSTPGREGGVTECRVSRPGRRVRRSGTGRSRKSPMSSPSPTSSSA